MSYKDSIQNQQCSFIGFVNNQCNLGVDNQCDLGVNNQCDLGVDNQCD